MKKIVLTLSVLISLNVLAENKPYLQEVINIMESENQSNGDYSDSDYTGHLIIDGKTT